MTEISKNSRNHRAETVSNTGGHSGNVPPYPYTGHPSESPERESANHSLNINGYNQDHVDSPQDNFEVSIKDILPLISSIKEENEYFKHEKKSLEGEMTNLHKLSQKLLSENQQLRKHHCTRTHDIKKIIDTISINTNQQINDINHESFLMKESNHLIVKEIQQKMKSNVQVNAKLQQEKRELQRITLVNINLKQNKRDLQVKNKQLFYRCQQLKEEVKQDDANKDFGQINDLTVQVTALKSQNKSKLLQARSLVSSHREQKPKFEQNHQHIVDQVKELQLQAKGLRETAQSSQQKLEQVKAKAQQSASKFNTSLRLYQRLKYQQLQKRQQILKLKAEAQERNKKIKNGQLQLQKVKDQKQNLMDLVRNKKAALKKGEEKLREQNTKLQSGLKNESKKMKQTLNKIIAKANQQIQTKLRPQFQKAAENTEINKQQFATLVQQIQEFQQNVKKLDNPIKEIIRLEYLVKKGR